MDQTFIDQQSRQALIQRLNKHGYGKIKTLKQHFRTVSIGGRTKIDKDEFLIGLKELNINLNNVQQSSLLRQFSTDGDGYIDLEHFIDGILGVLPENRREIITKAFQKHAYGDFIYIRDLRGNFNCQLSTSVRNGQKTEDEIFQEFKNDFQITGPDGCISFEDWMNYYKAISSTISSDENFIRLVAITYGI